MEEEDQRSKIKRCEPFPDITCVMSRVTRWDMPAKVIRMPGHGSRGGALCVKINDDVHDNLTCPGDDQGSIFRLTCSYPELTEDHVLTSAYVKILRTVTRNAVNKSV